MARGLDEEEAAVDAGVLDVSLALGGKLLAQVRRVLILDILDDRVPAPVVVDQVTVARGVDDVQPEPDAILLDDVRYGVDLGSRANDLLGLQPAFGLDEVGRKDGVDQGRLAQTGLACLVPQHVSYPYGRTSREHEGKTQKGDATDRHR